MSQFNALFKTNDKAKKESEPKRKSPAKEAQKKTSSPPPSPKTAVKQTVAKPAERTTGKSSNPDYTQALTYLRRETHNRVKAALIFDEAKRDLSDLVEELLSDWLKKNQR